MRPAESALSIRHAVALGLLQGPAELLPVSSSGHTTLLPWLAGWPYAELDGELRKSFEVALHAGAGAALAIDMRRELLAQARGMSSDRAAVMALSLAPAALTGFLLRAPIERRLGGPRSVAAGLALGAIAMALADARRPAEGRASAEAGPCDGLALGVAQAASLIPGVSRNGATLTAARVRGFSRRDAQTLSWEVALPVLGAASVLKGSRLLSGRGAPPPQARAALAAATASAFFSTALSARVLRRTGGTRSLAPYSLYRCLLAGAVMIRLRRAG
jgi:undecaprenyl-diphosphatase